jgi:hypothetical protein
MTTFTPVTDAVLKKNFSRIKGKWDGSQLEKKRLLEMRVTEITRLRAMRQTPSVLRQLDYVIREYNKIEEEL